MTNKTKQCPYCGEEIPSESTKCPYCDEVLEATTASTVDASQQKSMMECPICGELIEEGASVCPYCNEKIGTSPKTSVSSERHTPVNPQPSPTPESPHVSVSQTESLPPKGFFQYYFVEITLKRFFDFKGVLTGKQFGFRFLMYVLSLFSLVFVDEIIGFMTGNEFFTTITGIFMLLILVSLIASLVCWGRNANYRTAINYPTKHTIIDFVVWGVFIVLFAIYGEISEENEETTSQTVTEEIDVSTDAQKLCTYTHNGQDIAYYKDTKDSEPVIKVINLKTKEASVVELSGKYGEYNIEVNNISDYSVINEKLYLIADRGEIENDPFFCQFLFVVDMDKENISFIRSTSIMHFTNDKKSIEMCERELDVATREMYITDCETYNLE